LNRAYIPPDSAIEAESFRGIAIALPESIIKKNKGIKPDIRLRLWHLIQRRQEKRQRRTGPDATSIEKREKNYHEGSKTRSMVKTNLKSLPQILKFTLVP
jgi:hypothetical protein